jgi:hypothetical protein
MVPNIVLDLGLSVHAMRLYLEIKKTTGEKADGECYSSTSTLARACQMSTGSVSNAKKELLRSGLITIQRAGSTKRGTDSMRVPDIWKRNDEWARRRKGGSSDERTRSSNERTRSSDETNKTPLNKNPTNKKISHSESGVMGKEKLMKMGYESDDAEVIALWNAEMSRRGWWIVDTYSDEVVESLKIWDDEERCAETIGLERARIKFFEARPPNTSRNPTLVRFMRDNFHHALAQ